MLGIIVVANEQHKVDEIVSIISGPLGTLIIVGNPESILGGLMS